MSVSPRKAALVVAVSEPKPCAFLPGALKGATYFAAWAQAQGYETTLLTDEKSGETITLAALKAALEAILCPQTPEPPLKRLIFYFAGHGLIREAEQGLLLLSDWYSDEKAVAIEALKRKLARFDVEQVTIIADACRELPSDIVIADLGDDPVLGRGPLKRPNPKLRVDKFFAAQDGQRAYMIPGDDEDRCLFSGVLLEGLWAMKPGAVSAQAPNTVTSQSLAGFLQEETPRVAKRYELECDPIVLPTFPPGDDIYYVDGVSPKPPPFPPWPAPVSPPPPPPELAPDLGDDLAIYGFQIGHGGGDVQSSAGQRTAIVEQTRRFLGGVIEKRMRALHRRPGFSVSGAEVANVWARDGIEVEPDERPACWRINDPRGDAVARPAELLLEFQGGAFGALIVPPHRFACVTADERGIEAIVYEDVRESPSLVSLTARQLAEMHVNALRSSAADELARRIAQGSSDPVLAAICAYLFDARGDITSIQRIAAHLAERGDPIPFDVAMLSDFDIERRSDGLVVVGAPGAMRASPILSSWPMLRQGWAYLHPDDDFAPPDTLVIANSMKPARFTSFSEAGAKRVADLFAFAPALLENVAATT